MTDVTVGKSSLVDLILLQQPLALGELIEGRLPSHIEDLLARADIALGLAVAAEAPLHRHRLGLIDTRHLVDPPMAGGASDTLRHMDAVVEVDEVAQIVDAIPLDRHAAGIAVADGRKHGGLSPDL